MSFILVIVDDINLPRYRIFCAVMLKLILHIADVAFVLQTHANNHIAPKDD